MDCYTLHPEVDAASFTVRIKGYSRQEGYGNEQESHLSHNRGHHVDGIE